MYKDIKLLFPLWNVPGIPSIFHLELLQNTKKNNCIIAINDVPTKLHTHMCTSKSNSE